MTDSAAEAPEYGPLPVLFRDESFVAVSKPSGLLVHRDERHRDAPAALQVVRDQLDKFLYPVHRLDRATSGILVYGFSRPDAAALQASMMAADARKEYLALVRWPGRFPKLPAQWICRRPLHDAKEVARSARSEFSLIEAFRYCALISCRISTGRYHQIRRHLNHCGRHVFGDTTHGKGRLNEFYRQRYGLDRLFLHAHRLVLRHPTTGAGMELVDPLPVELEAVLQQLRAEAKESPDPAPKPDSPEDRQSSDASTGSTA